MDCSTHSQKLQSKEALSSDSLLVNDETLISSFDEDMTDLNHVGVASDDMAVLQSVLVEPQLNEGSSDPVKKVITESEKSKIQWKVGDQAIDIRESSILSSIDSIEASDVLDNGCDIDANNVSDKGYRERGGS